MLRVNTYVRFAALAAGAIGVIASTSAMSAPAETTRKVYVTVTDIKGQPIADLTTADFTVKEDGKERVVASVSPAKDKMRVVIALEEALTASGSARQGVFDLVKKIALQAESSLVVVGLGNRVVVPFTSDINAMVAGLNGLSLATRTPTANVPEGIGDLSRAFTKEKPARPVIVMIAIDTPQASAVPPRSILDALRDSNAQLHVVSLASGAPSGGTPAENIESSGRAQVLGDGPKQSGGRLHAINQPTAIPRVIADIANDMLNQYVITYTLPDGVAPSDRLAVSIKRRGATLRSPTRISSN